MALGRFIGGVMTVEVVTSLRPGVGASVLRSRPFSVGRSQKGVTMSSLVTRR
jgi:hypothetical protein